jgi:hypothetical protein
MPIHQLISKSRDVTVLLIDIIVTPTSRGS